MIDLHCHLLPGIDDGARDMSMSLEMARLAVADGITTTVCTPHITAGIYNNNSDIISDGIAILTRALAENDIELELLMGADIHIAPDISERLIEGTYPTIADTHYFLFEPSHHVLQPQIVNLARQIIANGYIPILTHPERLTWIEAHYDVIEALDEVGVAIQITAGAVTGRFGKRALYWSERLVEEGRVDIIATDAHNVRGRPPILSEGVEAVANRLGDAAARAMVFDNPLLVLENQPLPQKKLKNMQEISLRRLKGFSTTLTRWIDGFKK